MSRTLLIDADVVAYNAAFACERAIEWEPGYWTWHVEWDEVVKVFDEEVDRMVSTLNADDFKLCLTDSENNFRLGIHPDYKGRRTKVKKPIILKQFKQWLIDERGAYWRPSLEGDDVMGILATHPTLIKGEKVIVSIDKDMKTIPGKYIRWGTEDAEEVEITETEADYWFLYQTLTGDATDGYRGCPGIGPKNAEKILAEATRAAPEGEPILPYWWRAVVQAYEKQGLTEDDAIVQARMARILRASDYNFREKRPILWNPPE